MISLDWPIISHLYVVFRRLADIIVVHHLAHLIDSLQHVPSFRGWLVGHDMDSAARRLQQLFICPLL